MSSQTVVRGGVRRSARGAQEPRLRSVPDYVATAGQEAVELCALAGLDLDPWEQLVLMDMLGERGDGKWACYEFGLVVPRQNGKGACLEARELTGLFLLGEKLLIHSAHEQATSSEHFRRILNLIEGVPEFDRRVLKVVKGKGAEAIELRGGQRIFFKTRTQDGGRGLTGDFVGLDEAMKLRQSTMSALVPTMAARSITGNPQLVYAGSAVDAEKDEHGLVLARVRERASAGDSARLGYHEYSCEGDDPATVAEDVAGDPAMWAQANPGLGIRISLEYIADEREALDARSFAVERLGIGCWPDTTENPGRIISREAWDAVGCRDESKWIVGPKTFAVDLNPDRTWATIGVAGERDDQLWHIAVVDRRHGAHWVLDRCLALDDEHAGARFVLDRRGPAANLIDELEEAGLDVLIVDAADYAKACGGFFDAVATGTLRYPVPQPELDAAVADARTQPLGDAWKWSRRNSTSADITPLVACTLALWGAMNAESAYATVIFGSDHEPQEPGQPALAPQAPTVLEQADYTSCFKCSQGNCPIHER